MLQTLPPCMAVTDRRYRRNWSARFYRQPVRIGSIAPGGACPSPTRCVRSAIHGAKRQCLPEIATGAKRPRNDNSGAGAVLAIACSDRQHCAGRGVPLPYNAQLAASQNYPFSIIHLPRALSRFLQYYPSSPAFAFSVRMRRTLSSMRASVSVPSAAASRRACRTASRSSGIRMRSQPASMASRAASPGV